MTEPAWLGALHQRLRECGFTDCEISVAYQDELQDHLVRIAGAPTDDVLARLADFAASTGTLIDFDHRPTWERYAEVLEKAEAPFRQAAIQKLQASARAELATLGLLEGLPTYSQERDLAAFAAEVEMHAGFAAGSMLRVDGEVLTIQPSATKDRSAFNRLFLVLSASGFHEFGGEMLLYGEDAEG
jgi:hypothetical protein